MNLANLFSWWLQSLAVVLAAALCARWSHARSRLWFWQMTIGLCLMLPLFPWRQPAAQAPLDSVASTGTPVYQAIGTPRAVGFFERWEFWSADTLFFVIGVGVALRLLWIALGLWRLRAIRREADRIEPLIAGGARWFISSEIHSPVTYGYLRPVILLPANIMDLDEPLRRAMAEHEVVHIERADWVMVMLEECMRAALWFQPAVWYALAQIHKAREQAVDAEAVLRTGDRQSYLDALLTVAANRLEPDLAPAPLFLRKRQLASRVSALMKESTMSPITLLSRMVSATAAVAAVLALALWLRPLEAQAPIQPDSEGVTVDAGARLLHRSPIRMPADFAAGGLLVVDATLSPKGDVTDARVVSGPEALRRDALQSILQWHYDTPGGAPSAARISIQYPARQTAAAVLRPNAGPTNRTGAPLTPNARKVTGTQFVRIDGALRDRMEARLKDFVGKDVTPAMLPQISQAVEEVDSHALTTFRDSADHTTMSIEVAMPVETRLLAEYRLMEEARLRQQLQTPASTIAPPPTQPSATPPGSIRVGGNVQSTKLVSQAMPTYPPLARQARIQGTVRFNVVVDREGRVRETSLVSGHPLLVQAAQDAVQQWAYQPTLLNGQPVQVVTEVDVNFTLADGLGTLFQEQPRN